MTIKGKFTIDVYSCTIFVTIASDTMRSINYYHRKLGYNDLTEPVSGYFLPDTNTVKRYYLFFDEEDLSVNVVNHEKSHLVERILEDREIKSKDEVRSYLDGCVSEKLHEFFKKRNIKLPTKMPHSPR